MESVKSNLRYEWKKYLIALWMIGITALVFHMDMKVRQLVTKVQNIDATMSSIEGIVSGSDYTLGNIEKKVVALEKSVYTISRRVKRLK
jgi:hypothetical protein